MVLRMNEKDGEKEKITTSSQCSSGWTMYFDHSDEKSNSISLGRTISMHQYHQKEEEVGDDEEEDLSMVSDASSGPPHFNDDEDDRRHFYETGKKRRVEKKMQTRKQETARSSLLDDTASSPFFSLSKSSCNGTRTNHNEKLFVEDVLELACGSSATQLKRKSALRKHMGYFKSCAHIEPTSVSMEEGEKKLC